MLALATVLSALIGVTLGLLGGGGSILTLPLLVYVVKEPARDAITLSLLVVGVTSLAALVPHLLAGRVRWRIGLIFGAAGMVAAFLGGRAARLIPSAWLMLAFAGIMLATAIPMIAGRRIGEGAAARPPSLPRVALLGAAVGLLSGLVGAGGGFLIVPALVLFGGLPMSAAIGTSLAVIAMNSVAGFAGHLSDADVDWALAALLTTAAVLGSVVGARLAGRVPQPALRKAFGWLVLVMAIVMIGKLV